MIKLNIEDADFYDGLDKRIKDYSLIKIEEDSLILQLLFFEPE